MTPAFAALLAQMRHAHEAIACLRDFVAFPDDLTEVPYAPRWLPCAEAMRSEVGFRAASDPLAQAFLGGGAD